MANIQSWSLEDSLPWANWTLWLPGINREIDPRGEVRFSYCCSVYNIHLPRLVKYKFHLLVLLCFTNPGSGTNTKYVTVLTITYGISTINYDHNSIRIILKSFSNVSQRFNYLRLLIFVFYSNFLIAIFQCPCEHKLHRQFPSLNSNPSSEHKEWKGAPYFLPLIAIQLNIISGAVCHIF